jgi:hypothetical protein
MLAALIAQLMKISSDRNARADGPQLPESL